MRSATVMLLAFAAVACEGDDKVAPPDVTRPTEAITISSAEREVVSETPTSHAPPPIPGQLLEKLTIEREGSFALAESTELTLSAAVVLGDEHLAFAGQAWTCGDLDPGAPEPAMDRCCLRHRPDARARTRRGIDRHGDQRWPGRGAARGHRWSEQRHASVVRSH